MRRFLGRALVAGLCAVTMAAAQEDLVDQNSTLELVPFPEEVVAPLEDGLTTAQPDADITNALAEEDDLRLIGDAFSEDGTELMARPEVSAKDADAFDELVRDNLSLRSELDAARQARDEERSSLVKLQKQIQDLESRLAESVTLVTTLQQAGRGSVEAPLQTQKLLTQLDAERLESKRLSDEIAALNSRLQAAGTAVVGGPSPVQGSDLYQVLEKENAELKQQLAAAESARLEAVQAKASAAVASEQSSAAREAAQVSEAALKQQMDDALKAQESYKAAIGKLAESVPEMERRLAEVSTTLQLKERQLAERDQEVGLLKTELQRREDRVRRAERMAKLLEETREQVREQSTQEMRDMHFNTGVIYMREGRYAGSEKEFMKALQVDPADADTHYNLGVLYDDYIGNRNKALQHFKAYLKFAPEAPDAAQVQSWIVRLGMN